MRDRANATATALEHGVKSAGILHKTHTVCRWNGNKAIASFHSYYFCFVFRCLSFSCFSIYLRCREKFSACAHSGTSHAGANAIKRNEKLNSKDNELSEFHVLPKLSVIIATERCALHASMVYTQIVSSVSSDSRRWEICASIVLQSDWLQYNRQSCCFRLWKFVLCVRRASRRSHGS